MDSEERLPILTARGKETIVEGVGDYQENESPSDHYSVRFRWIRLLVCVLVLALGTLSAAMGIFAEYYSAKDIEAARHSWRCEYPGHLVITLSIGGAILLGVAHVLVNIFGFSANYSSGDSQCKDQNPPAPSTTARSQKAIAISWGCCLLALYYFSAGERVRETNRAHNAMRDGMCTAVKELVFVKAGVFSFIATAFGLGFYLAQCALRDIADAKLESSEEGSPAQPRQASEAYLKAKDHHSGSSEV